MKYILTILALLTISLTADKIDILSKKGARIANVLCNKSKLEATDFQDIETAKKVIIDEKICSHLNKKQLEAVATYAVSLHTTAARLPKIDVPKDAKCPICGMFVAKYPKWAAYMKDENGQDFYFDGVKDMMKYYFNHPKEQFKTILVSDFYTLRPLDGREAYYVIGSNVYGPMGEELIPFKTEEDARVFKEEHYGKKIIRFDEIKEDYLY